MHVYSYHPTLQSLSRCRLQSYRRILCVTKQISESKMAKSPTCCCCMNIRTGALTLAIIYLVLGVLSTLGGFMNMARMNQSYGYGYGYHSTSTAYIVNIIIGLLIVLFGSLTVHGIRTKRAGLIMPMFVYMILDIVCTVVVTLILCIYWNAIYQYILELLEAMDASADCIETIQKMGPGGLGALVIGTVVLFLLLKIYFSTVFYRCYKDIQMTPVAAPISTLAWQQASVEAGNIYTPARVADVQKIPLVDDMEPVDTMPPAYMAQNA